MGYLYLSLQALMFSFGGLMIKASLTMVSPIMISFLRFTIGLALLFAIQRKRLGKFDLSLMGRLIVIGGIAKAIHYLGENIGVMRGFSYGGVLVWPVQTLVVFFVSTLIYREKTSKRTIAGAFACILGVGILSWNGASFQDFLGSGFLTLASFVMAGIASAIFSLSQKRLVHKMDLITLNTSMFVYGWVTTLVVLPFTGGHFTGEVNFTGVLSLLLLGAITCVGFLLQGAALKTVPLLIATVIQSSTVILTILWGVLFYGDPLSVYAVVGTALFIGGILLINIRREAGEKAKA